MTIREIKWSNERPVDYQMTQSIEGLWRVKLLKLRYSPSTYSYIRILRLF